MYPLGTYIRRTKSKTVNRNKAYYTYRIVESIRLGEKVKQRTLLNLGNDFSIEQEHWPLLCARIEQLLQSSDGVQGEIFDLPDELNQSLEAAAQRYFALILQKHTQPLSTVDLSSRDAEASAQDTLDSDYHRVDIHHAEAQDARSIGVETLALHALQQLQPDQKLTAMSFNGIGRAAGIGLIIGRVVSPGSELHTHDGLNHRIVWGR